VEVVEKPFRCGRDLALVADRLGDVSVPGQKRLGVLADPGEKIPPFAGLVGCALCRGQALGVLLQALDAEELGANRLFPLGRSDNDGVGGVHFEFDVRGLIGHGERNRASLSPTSSRHSRRPVLPFCQCITSRSLAQGSQLLARSPARGAGG
jgi:hypothetical protein